MNRLVLLGAVCGLAASARAAEPGAPVPGPDRPFAPPAAVRARLPGGLSLLVVEQRQLPLVHLLLVIPGAGAAADPPGKAGLAAFTADLVDEGTAGKDAMAIARAADALGATLRSGADRRAAYVSVSTLARTLEPALALLGEVVTQPAFAPAEVKRVHGDRMTALALRRDRPREIAGLRLDAALFGAGSPQGHPVDGEAATFRKLGAADARAFHAATWDPARATLVVVGDVSAADALPLVAARLGDWAPRRGARRPPAMPEGKPAPTRLVLVDRPGAQQSDVVFGVRSIPPSDARVPAWEVMLNAFGGGFTGRLTQVLRERLGYLYHVYPELEYDARGGTYHVLAPLFSPRTADGMKEILAMVDDIAANGLPPAELEKARKNLVRDLPERFATSGDTARTFGELVLLGLPDDHYVSYGRKVGAVESAAARDVARELLAGKLVFAVVGDLAKVRAAVEALGLGRPEVYDLEGRRTR
jgi:predicted Zn-dependent peptidase